MTIEEIKNRILYIYNGIISEEEINRIIVGLNNILFKKNYSISNLKIIGDGESSLVFEGNDEIIKLTLMEYDNHKSLKEYVSHSKHILHPTEEVIIDLNGYSAKILFLPKLSLDNITGEDILNMYCDLRDDGYLWNDTKLENVGKDKNGNCLLLDYGELIYVNDMPLYKQNSELESHRMKKAECDKMYLERQQYNEQSLESGRHI